MIGNRIFTQTNKQTDTNTHIRLFVCVTNSNYSKQNIMSPPPKWHKLCREAIVTFLLAHALWTTSAASPIANTRDYDFNSQPIIRTRRFSGSCRQVKTLHLSHAWRLHCSGLGDERWSSDGGGANLDNGKQDPRPNFFFWGGERSILAPGI